MSYEATYNPLDPIVANVVIAWNEVDVPTGNPNTINNPDISLVGGTYQTIQPVNNCIVSGNQIIPFTTQQQTNWNTAIAAAVLAGQKTAAETDITSPADIGKLERAAVDQLLTQLNAHTNFETSLLAAIAAASSLVNLQSRCAGLTTPSQVTLSQAKTAIINEISSGGEGD